MNFGQNLYNWFLSNAQSLVLMAIVVIGIYLGFKREFSKLIGFLVIALIAVGLVFNAGGVKDVLLELYPTATDKELAYYVEGNALEPITGDYLYSELVNPVFTADGDNVKVSVAVKFIDNQTKATQVSQYELTLHKDSNWKIIE